MLPTISKEKIIEIAEKIRKNIKDFIFKADKKTFSMTISIGLAKYTKGMDIDTLIGNADNALYKAKNMGRDNIIHYEEDMKTKFICI